MRQLKFIVLLLAVLSIAVFYGAQAATPTTKPAAKAPVVKLVAKPVTKPVVKPVAKAVVKPVTAKAVAAKHAFAVKSAAEIKKLTETFIKNNLISTGTQLKLSEPRDLNPGLFELNVFLDDDLEAIKVYVTKDGKLFFPQGMDLVAGLAKKPEAPGTPTPATAPTPAVVNKSDRPVVELFVMSHCPFGTQVEKGILPVVKLLGSKIDMQLKNVNYVMHGAKESTEQLNQYCLNKIKPTVFWNYLECFLADENSSATCLAKVAVTPAELASCVQETDAKYQITASSASGNYPAFNIFDADNKKYGVEGSPTLVINGAEVSAGRSPAALLQAICEHFTVKPAECSTVLASETPAAGFGLSAVASSNTAASCQ